ncbi:MAG: hypothetical protein LBG05_10375 [Treponema sp.]|jgi:hypothetical protein|nr:hypothetical protein [Treponema sp.]
MKRIGRKLGVDEGFNSYFILRRINILKKPLDNSQYLSNYVPMQQQLHRIKQNVISLMGDMPPPPV